MGAARALGYELDSNNITWLDLEMTGLNPETKSHQKKDRILEAAVIITTPDLEILHEAGPFYVHQPEHVLADMNAWCRRHHFASGLVAKVRASKMREEEVEGRLLESIGQYVPLPGSGSFGQEARLAGNSIAQDRRFIREYMPRLDAIFSYRMLDVSSFKIAREMWFPHIPEFEKKLTHRALDDIRESIAEMKYYKERILLPSHKVLYASF